MKYSDSVDREAAFRLTKMIMKLFELWSLSLKEQSLMLDISTKSTSTIASYKSGRTHIRLARDRYDRVCYFLSIHKALKILFPKNKVLAYSWPKARNRAFNDKTPIEVIVEDGYLGLHRVHSYLRNVLKQ